ncbi:hypothetical protein CLAFUW4_13519 [Fulvia fulva]|uniref:Uncharacterized protein n=1 Tax=Passalora fulva TaxID=5499 RepID=A0A9Q8UW67_PASFU|nr:uncharacterized protein CLAFUR5_13370 [Fulvia fulva]KAK4610467.1 hypothetical protein CLAFUR4_13521 [Fulvia fulva]KAK4611004.1 hypothetical protein CLAFUR0_13530 [Fulvia fulva]UJO24670.1 hypothetical protein CLAFUR5_13370 [Fulvia fulva]WPV21845.1 hypothetical protein CLAFUW4_13519 [Fulvia fulva]WPV36864.1 hypothetical protein CLAFUW7_13526 [Fulvia fulva]
MVDETLDRSADHETYKYIQTAFNKAVLQWKATAETPEKETYKELKNRTEDHFIQARAARDLADIEAWIRKYN